MRDLERLAQQAARVEVPATSSYAASAGHSVTPPEKWAHSTVSKFHVHYSPPVPDLPLDYSVEALVEGSDMSMVHDGAPPSSFFHRPRTPADVVCVCVRSPPFVRYGRATLVCAAPQTAR